MSPERVRELRVAWSTVRQSTCLKQRVTRRKIIVGVFAAMAALLLTYQRGSSNIAVSEPQVRRQQRRIRPGPASRARTTSDTRASSSFFKHEDHRLPKSKLNCSECHTIPTQAAPDEMAAATKPSIKGYPYHDSCLNCHRATPPQMFRGTTPVICAVCHTRSSPRLTARDLNPFPKHDETFAPEFSSYFSHGSRDHQIAIRNCENCHVKDDRAPAAIAVSSSEEPYKPGPGTFKTSPSGHASCFGNCHWDKDDPKKDNCAGCHLTPDVFAQKQRTQLPANIANFFGDWPREWPRRFSLKFNHESKNHREAENPELVCTACHISIKQSETLDIPNVPIATCASSKCHLKSAKPSLEKEMLDEDDDILNGKDNDPESREGKNACTGCHTKMIGSLPPPCSHYLLFGDTYFKPEDYPKSAKQLFARCKK